MNRTNLLTLLFMILLFICQMYLANKVSNMEQRYKKESPKIQPVPVSAPVPVPKPELEVIEHKQ